MAYHLPAPPIQLFPPARHGERHRYGARRAVDPAVRRGLAPVSRAAVPKQDDKVAVPGERFAAAGRRQKAPAERGRRRNAPKRQAAPHAPVADGFTETVRIADDLEVFKAQTAQNPVEYFITDTAVMRGKNSEFHSAHTPI